MKVHLFVLVSCQEDRCERQEKCESLTVRKWCSGWHERGREVDEEDRVRDRKGSGGFFSSSFLLWVGSRGGRGGGLSRFLLSRADPNVSDGNPNQQRPLRNETTEITRDKTKPRIHLPDGTEAMRIRRFSNLHRGAIKILTHITENLIKNGRSETRPHRSKQGDTKPSTHLSDGTEAVRIRRLDGATTHLRQISTSFLSSVLVTVLSSRVLLFLLTRAVSTDSWEIGGTRFNERNTGQDLGRQFRGVTRTRFRDFESQRPSTGVSPLK
ncbi:hypothetical protein BHM03_00019858 [Ensete ventricosum]|nr:hypothetical protein BHM03_00019858 [Ensete ventricosum]